MLGIGILIMIVSFWAYHYIDNVMRPENYGERELPFLKACIYTMTTIVGCVIFSVILEIDVALMRFLIDLL